jgi:hypothetical protein
MRPHRGNLGVVLSVLLLGASGALADECTDDGRFPACSPHCPTTTGCAAMCPASDPDIDTCCSRVTTFPCSTDPQQTEDPSKTSDLNIFLVVTDDQAYCHYGFMNGQCSGSPYALCTSEMDCPTGERCESTARCTTGESPPGEFPPCVSDDDCPSGASARAVADWRPNAGKPCTTSAQCGGGDCELKPLRLAELTCRNRQPAAVDPDAATHCADGADAPVHNQDIQHFPFDRQKYPCAGTTTAERLAVRTPVLDTLAAQGAVFTRAHVGGNACKSSRRVMHHGKYQRHLQYLWGPGRATVQSRREQGTGGCAQAAALPCLPARVRTCTIAWWLTQSPAALGNERVYKTAAFGKLESFSPPVGSFDATLSSSKRSVGKFTCLGDDATCYATLKNQRYFDPPTPGLLPKSVFTRQKGIGKLIEFVTDSGVLYTDAQGRSRRDHPFYIWYGPNIPHESPRPEDALYTLYAGKEAKLEQEHFGRASWLDAGVGGFIEYLKRTCVCSTSRQRESLYASTVVLVLTDNGFLLKGAKQNRRENTHRTVMIVNEPRHRKQGTATIGHRILGYDMPHAIDLLPTIMGYAGLPTSRRRAVGTRIRSTGISRPSSSRSSLQARASACGRCSSAKRGTPTCESRPRWRRTTREVRGTTSSCARGCSACARPAAGAARCGRVA